MVDLEEAPAIFVPKESVLMLVDKVNKHKSWLHFIMFVSIISLFDKNHIS